MLFVNNDDAGGYAGAIKQVGRQADDAQDVAFFNQIGAYHRLGIAPKQHAVGQDARTLALAFKRAYDVQQIRIVTLLGGWLAIGFKALKRVVLRVYAGAPAFVAKGWVGNHVVKGFELVAVFKLGIGQGVTLHNLGGGVVVQDHVHAGQAAGGRVFFLAVEGDFGAGFFAHFQQQRA